MTIFQDLLNNQGLNEATDVILSGGSAGGVVIFLYILIFFIT